MNTASKLTNTCPGVASDLGIKIVRLDESSFKEAKSIIYQAYRFEPTFKYLFDSERPGYDQRVRATIRELMELHFQKRQDVIGVSMDGLLVAVALIGSPDVRMKLSDQLNWRLRMMLTAGLSSTRRYMDYHQQVVACLPADQHHELPLLGVHPKYQNKGVGRLLFNAIEQVCAESSKSAGIGLDTGNSRYLEFYNRMGFATVGEVRMGGITEYVLFKPSTSA